MGFFTGRVAFSRFRVAGKSPRAFGPVQLKALEAYAVGKQRISTSDGIQVGWTAAGHVLDTRFDLAKNVVNDALHFAFRMDIERLPADLLRAYTQIELDALSAGNSNRMATARQKREARESARDRLELEAKDGRYLRHKAYEVLWDAPSNELLVGTTAMSVFDRLIPQFEATFEQKCERIKAGRLAFDLAELREQTRRVDDAAPATFVPGTTPVAYVWMLDEASRDFLGNEFLFWLWYTLDNESDTIKLADGSEIVGMLARTLTLECPRGQTGKESITSEGPSRLPEAKRALQAGKLPRKCGLTLVRNDQTFELTLHAETFAVTAAKLPPLSEESDRARVEERVALVRQLIEALDLLYDAFGRRRFADEWPKELANMQKWLARESRPRLTA